MATTRDYALQLARETLIEILEEKLQESGHSPNRLLVEAVADHGLSGAKDDFVWENLTEELSAFLDTLQLTDTDLARMEARQSTFRDELAELLKDTVAQGSGDLFKDLKARWPQVEAQNRHDMVGFQQRLEARWGEAFNHIRMLRHFSLEVGYERQQRLNRSRAKHPKLLPHLLLRLHARAVQVVGEVLALMEAGYADGAMARWRTLHEITVVALVLGDGGEDLATRFIAHEAVGRLQAARLHQATCAARQEAPIPDAEFTALEAEQQAAIDLYGQPFKKEYGWAADYIGNVDPKFNQLEDAADRASHRPEYKLASYNIHAGSRGLFFKLGTLDGSGFMAGSSDAGFSSPGLATLDTLVLINFALMPKPLSLDDLLLLSTLDAARMGGRTAFMRSADKLRRDHARIQREAAKAGTKRRRSRKPRSAPRTDAS